MNKRIAELRGERGKKCTNSHPQCIGRAVNGSSSISHGCTCREPDEVPYDTDIACAMELLQEMRDEGNYNALELVKAALLRWATSHEDAGTLPEEIAGAYIKWKENNGK